MPNNWDTSKSYYININIFENNKSIYTDIRSFANFYVHTSYIWEPGFKSDDYIKISKEKSDYILICGIEGGTRNHFRYYAYPSYRPQIIYKE